MSASRGWRRLIPALIASVVLVALLATVTDLKPQRLAGTLGTLSPGLVALAFLVYAGSYVGRGLRLAVLLPRVSSVLHFTSISARHTFLAVVMPFRSGEAALPLLLASEAGRPLPEGVSMLGLMRILDLVAVAAYLLIGLAFFSGLTGASPSVMAERGGGALVVLLLCVALMRPICARLAVLAQSEGRLRVFIGRAAQHVADLRTGQLMLAVLTSLLTWLCTYGACFLVLRAMAGAPDIGPEIASIGFAQSLVGTTGLHLGSVIPVSPVAGVGTWEAGWTTGYALTGVKLSTAATTAVVCHIVIFAFIALIGLLGHLTRRLGRGGRQHLDVNDAGSAG